MDNNNKKEQIKLAARAGLYYLDGAPKLFYELDNKLISRSRCRPVGWNKNLVLSNVFYFYANCSAYQLPTSHH